MAERAGTRVTGGREGYSEQGTMLLLSRANRAPWSLELVQTQPPNKLPTSSSPCARNEEELIFWTRLPLKTSLVHAVSGGHVGICGSAELPQAVLKPDSPWSVQPLVAMFKSLATTGGQVDILSLCYRRRSY